MYSGSWFRAAPTIGSSVSRAGSAGRQVTVYVANTGSDTVTPIATATNTAGPPITVGLHPGNIAITPDGKSAYVTNLVSGTVTGIATATQHRRAAAGVDPLTLTARNKTGTATRAFTLTITRAPAIRKIRATRAKVGVALHLTIRATGYPLPGLAESGPLPAGLSFTDNENGTAIIAAPTGSGGRYPMTITATNTYGTATRLLTIVVSQRRKR